MFLARGARSSTSLARILLLPRRLNRNSPTSLGRRSSHPIRRGLDASSEQAEFADRSSTEPGMDATRADPNGRVRVTGLARDQPRPPMRCADERRRFAPARSPATASESDNRSGRVVRSDEISRPLCTFCAYGRICVCVSENKKRAERTFC